MRKEKNEIVVFQAKNGAIELRADYKLNTIWANINEIADLFEINKSNVSRHIHKIFEDGELIKDSTVAKIATVEKQEGSRKISRSIEYYSLDIVLAVGYRARSAYRAIQFRKWASKVLKQYIVDGYVFNPSKIKSNYEQFLKAVEDVKKLLPDGSNMQAKDALDLIKLFAGTWFSLDAYDKSSLPMRGMSKKQVEFTAEELAGALMQLKNDLMSRKEATHLFAEEKRLGNLSSIVGNVFQSVFGEDAYPTIEEKAAHLLYFIIKNHPFNDGNKRSGAFAFVWFLRKANLLDSKRISPEALTALALLIAESNPKDKEKMVGIVLLLIGEK